jgi:hypothetical protein
VYKLSGSHKNFFCIFKNNICIEDLAGQSADDKARADMIVDMASDIVPIMMEIYKEKEQNKKVI